MARVVTYRYIDPLTQVWVGTARKIGLRVIRTPDAYAATDGVGTLAIGTPNTLDPDDSLAQMIFHELCHSLVEGEESFHAPDWGMDNTGPDHDWREHACLRVQWVLTGRYGLRVLFAPTTDFRTSFWDALSGDVLADRTDRSVQAAITALNRAAKPPWGPHLDAALAATARIAREAAALSTEPDVLWSGVPATAPALHPTGLPLGEVGASPAASLSSSSAAPLGEVGASPSASSAASAASSASSSSSSAASSSSSSSSSASSSSASSSASSSSASSSSASSSSAAPAASFAEPSPAASSSPVAASCGSCAWRYEQRGIAKCRQAGDRKIEDAWPSCERYEAAPSLDCQTCGACCREAYHSVEVVRKDPVVNAQPSYIVDRGTYLEVRRSGNRCSALCGGEVAADTNKVSRYHCAIYDDRPRTCRDFTLGSAHCLTARRRVGLSL